MNRRPTYDEITATIHRVCGRTTSDPERVNDLTISLSLAQAQNLAIAAGWLPTAALDDCMAPDGQFCCPGCGAGTTRLHVETNGPADIRRVSGFTSDTGIVIEQRGSYGCCRPGAYWWARCGRCQLAFLPPATIRVYRRPPPTVDRSQ